MVGLWDRKDGVVRRSPAACGGGWRSRAACCTPRACCSSTSRPIGLDPQTRVVDLGLHQRAARQREDITIFLTTHYMDEAEHCDRIAIIDHGQDRRPRHAGGAEGAAWARTGCRSTPPTTRPRSRRWPTDFGIEAADARGRGDLLRRRRASSSCRGCSPSSASRSDRSACPGRSLDDVFMSYTGTTIRDAEAVGTEPMRQMAALMRGRR